MSSAADLLARAREARARGDQEACRAAALQAAEAGRKERAWETVYHAYACGGRLHLQRGEPREACRWFDLARRIAERYGLTWWAGPALHDLFLCARDAGDVEEARRLAAAAWAAYGERHPRVGAFLADWIGLSLPPERWDPYFRPFTVPDLDPSDRVAALACLLRSAAARRDRLRAAEAWHRLRDAAGEDVAGAALALADAAEALDRLGLCEAAEAAAERARELAEIRGEGRVRERAERTLSKLRSAPVGSAAATS